MKMQSLRDGNYYACKQMKQHFERYVTRQVRTIGILCQWEAAIHLEVCKL